MILYGCVRINHFLINVCRLIIFDVIMHCAEVHTGAINRWVVKKKKVNKGLLLLSEI